MIPILYDKTETEFISNGIGRLSDAISCIVTEERNGPYELEMTYLEDGKYASAIRLDRIIWAKPSVYGNEQPFRIYKVTKPLNKQFKVYAQHISYDLAYATVKPCQGVSALDSLTKMLVNADRDDLYSAWSDVSTTAGFVANPLGSFRNWCGGRQGSILDVYGGEFEWDRYTVKLWSDRGTNRGLVLRYGKNITDITQEQDIDYTIQGISPYMVTADGITLWLPEKTIWGGSYDTPAREKVLDMSSYVNEQKIREDNPTATEGEIETMLIIALRQAAESYVDANIDDTPLASIEVSFVDLGSTEEYKGMAALFTQAGLCDTVTVQFERLGISTMAKIVKAEYNVLMGRFEKLTIGKVRTNLAQNIYDAGNSSRIGEANSNARIKALIGSLNVNVEDLGDEIENTAQNLQAAIENATELITGQEGGYVVIDQDLNGKPYQILIMDTPDKTTATNVWRWNQAGLGFSSTGYSGTYGTAITYDGKIVADYIATGHLSASLIDVGILDASLIQTGILSDYAGRNWWNMSNGEFSFCNGNMFYDIDDGNFIQLNNKLSLKLDGIPLAGMDVSDLVTLDPLMQNKVSGLNAIAYRYPYTVLIDVVFHVTTTFSSSDFSVFEMDVTPVTIPPGHTSAPIQLLQLMELNSSSQPTGNICALALGEGALTGKAEFRVTKASSFRSGYSYTGQMTFQVQT